MTEHNNTERHQPGTDQCRECDEPIESGIVCDECEDQMDAMISLFSRLNGGEDL